MVAKRDRRGESQRLSKPAIAKGYTSRGQEYRARKKGYTNAGAYQAAVELKRNPSAGVVKKAAQGKLLGGTTNLKGTVIAASWQNDEQAEQWRSLVRFGDFRRITIAVEYDRGPIRYLGQDHGGYRLAWIKNEVRKNGGGGDGWETVVLELLAYAAAVSTKYKRPSDDDETEPPEILNVTVTVV